MSHTALRFVGGLLAAPDGPLPATLTVRDGRIDNIDPDTHAGPDHATSIDLDGLLLAPGFIDLQVNGGHGVDLTSELGRQPERLWELARQLPSQGVTAFLPTVVSSPAASVDAALASLTDAPADHAGASPLGVHAEGPMLAPAKRGTHDPAQLRAPDPSLIDGWSRDAGIVMVTVAPELPGALQVIRTLSDRGVVVSIGHTDATFDQTLAGLDAGARAGTHLWNAMSGWTARQPGAVGALVVDPRPIVGLIVDGVHLHPGTVRAMWRALGPERIALITDAIAAAGTQTDQAVLGGRTVSVTDGVVRDQAGALAGSVLTMDRAVRELVTATGTDPFTALRSASTTPATLIGADDRGHLSPGARGDLVVLTPDLEVVATFVAGILAAHPRPDLVTLPPELTQRVTT